MLFRSYNSDGSLAEISGNGTRCAAAFLIRHGYAPGLVRIRTGAGIKTLRLIQRRENARRPFVEVLEFFNRVSIAGVDRLNRFFGSRR